MPCLARGQSLQSRMLCTSSLLLRHEWLSGLRRCMVACLLDSCLCSQFASSSLPARWPLTLEKAGCFNLLPWQLSVPTAFSWQKGEQPLVPNWGSPGLGSPPFSSISGLTYPVTGGLRDCRGGEMRRERGCQDLFSLVRAGHMDTQLEMMFPRFSAPGFGHVTKICPRGCEWK